MKEFNNREIANKHAEYVTGRALRKYLADKVEKYVGKKSCSIFDGAAGSGQLEQYIQPDILHAVEIQENACEYLKENYPQAIVSNQSFFTYDSDIQVDAVVMNPPYSLKFKDLSDEEKQAINNFFPWKKSGVVDDIFLLKSLKYTKRFGFYIMFSGISYRASEKMMRQIIGTQLVEINKIDNGFADTNISVIFIVIDKEKTSRIYSGEIYDCKTSKVLHTEENELDDDFSWMTPRIEVEKEKIDIDAVNNSLDKSVLVNLENHLRSQLMVIQVFGADIDYLGFIECCRQLLTQYELDYNFGVVS